MDQIMVYDSVPDDFIIGNAIFPRLVDLPAFGQGFVVKIAKDSHKNVRVPTP